LTLLSLPRLPCQWAYIPSRPLCTSMAPAESKLPNIIQFPHVSLRFFHCHRDVRRSGGSDYQRGARQFSGERTCAGCFFLFLFSRVRGWPVRGKGNAAGSIESVLTIRRNYGAAATRQTEEKAGGKPPVEEKKRPELWGGRLGASRNFGLICQVCPLTGTTPRRSFELFC